MKKLILLSFVAIAFSSCLKEKSYNCECTYVPMSAWHSPGTPNKVENLTVKGVVRDDASSDCSIDNEGKYFTQHYDGTCILTN